MRKANDIRMSCNRASQLRSLSLIGFLLCQSLQSVVSLPAILSDVEVASKLRAEPVMELSKSGHTSEKAVESLSTDQLKVPKTNTKTKWGPLDESFRTPKKSVGDQSVSTDTDSVKSTPSSSPPERPGAPSLLTWTKEHKDMVQNRLNEMANNNRFATIAEINKMFYEAEAELSGRSLEEVYKTVKPSSYNPFQTSSTVTPISPHTRSPPHWTNEFQASPAIAPPFVTYTPPDWTREIQAHNLDHMAYHPSWQPPVVDPHNEFAFQGHHPNLHNFPKDAGLLPIPPYSAQHVVPDGFNPYIVPNLGHTQGYHPYTYDPALSHPEAQRGGTGYFYPQQPHEIPMPYHEYDPNWKANSLDHKQDFKELEGAIDEYRHHEGFMPDDLPHVDEFHKPDGYKPPPTYNHYFTSHHKPEVPNPYERTATSWKSQYTTPYINQERQSKFSEIGKDERFHPKIKIRQGIEGTEGHGDQLTPSSRPVGLKYPKFDFLSPNRYQHTWPTDEAPITTNMGTKKPTYLQVLAA